MDMKKMFFLLALLLGSMGIAFGQSHGEIQVVSENAQSITYQFRLDQLDSSLAAARLEEALESKDGIKTATATFSTKVCEVVVYDKHIKPENIADVVKHFGFEIAKSFDPQ